MKLDGIDRKDIINNLDKILKDIIFVLIIFILLSCSRDWSNPLSPDGNNNNHIPTDGLIAYYPFNGNANDESGNGHNGTVQGATLTSDRNGIAGSAYSFDGVNDYIDIGNNLKPQFPITVSTWIFLTNLEEGCIFRNDRWDDTGYRYGLGIYINTGKIAGIIFSGYAMSSTRSGKTSLQSVVRINEWSHFLVVFNNCNDMQLFFNSIEINGEYAGTGSTMTYSSSNGALGKLSIQDGLVHGNIDDIRIYNRSLSVEEIQALFHEGGW